MKKKQKAIRLYRKKETVFAHIYMLMCIEIPKQPIKIIELINEFSTLEGYKNQNIKISCTYFYRRAINNINTNLRNQFHFP